MLEVLFILGFSLHNIEEALWLPNWSKNAKGFHKEVNKDEFRFAVIVITAVGYLVTFQYYLFSEVSIVSKNIFLGFVTMMVLNTLFPHLIATVVLKRYAPGLITGLFLNLPIGLFIIINKVDFKLEFQLLIIATLSITVIILFIIKFLFYIGGKIFND